jgi:hypothetical protein
MVEVAHQGRAGLTPGHVARRTTHVDIYYVGAGGFRDSRTLGHPVSLASGKLNDVRTYPGCLASQPRHWAAVREIVARGHLGHHQPGAEFTRQTSKGSIGDARHRREKNPVRNFNIAYFQWLKA